MHRITDREQEIFMRYLPYSGEDERLGMVCTTVGECEVAPYTVYPPQKLGHPAVFRPVAERRVLHEFQLVFITKGHGTFSCDEKDFSVTPGSMMLLLPGVEHQYKPDFKTGWHERWVGFDGSYFRRLLDHGILSREKVFFNTGVHYDILAIFHRIFDEFRGQRPLYQFKACAGILSLIAEILSREQRKEQPNYYQKIVDRAKYFMERNIHGAVNMHIIADQVGISVSRLNEIFKNHTGLTVYQYYIYLKISEASIMLVEEYAPVRNVAFRLGFEDACYFSRLFKNKTGIAPSHWRQFVCQEQ
ncbi:MAG: AraC family ligand binding domain-containing protein [Spirochaetaceae bacterium]|jgi:AraC-like DNA-binding protein|nr:AraC family ligand binding domain-containing protein [Spirochaetaceae bacterium]